MNDKLPALKVHVLGGFSITYGERPISFGKNNTTKAMILLQLLLLNKEYGIARETILEALYGREELADVANSLRVTTHRVKKMLVDVGLPQYDYIKIKKGIYQWDSPMETEIDADVFEQLIKTAETEKNKEKAAKMYKDACRMYAGDFLPDLSSEDWVLLKSVYYKNLYSEALRKSCDWMMAHGDYEETLRMCAPACKMYPFDEWQTVRVECYIALKRYKDAMREYEDTARLLFEELGISPSERMLKQFEIMSSHMNYKPQELKTIKSKLKEAEDETGAYYCNLPSFRDNYRLVSRIIERNGQSVYLMLCSITNGKGELMTNEAKVKVMADELYSSIKHSLRRGDSFTKYSPSQFLALLVGTDKESCKIIHNRITSYFCREHASWKQYVDFYVSSVADVERQDSKIRFDENDDTIW